jgi:hypothetical protein
MTSMNINYVLAPFHRLVANCQNNVLLGLRIIEKTSAFPGPTPEETQFIQLAPAGHLTSLDDNKVAFKNWILMNGFEDIHKCIRVTFERLVVFMMIRQRIYANEQFVVEEYEKSRSSAVRDLNFPDLIGKATTLRGEELKLQCEMESFNNARNCLVHASGVVTAKHCNNPEKNKLTIHGSRFKMFFKKGEEEVPAEIGTAGPENAALMLGAEPFQIQFSLGQKIDLSLKQFIDVVNTCIFIAADIECQLRKHASQT